MIRYISTRNTDAEPERVTSAEAIKKGLAPDGGLYVPDSLPLLTGDDLDMLCPLPYPDRAAEILGRFLPDYDRDLLLEDCRQAYDESRFPGGPAPLRLVGNDRYVLELWHGPTCAFKDMALQIMPRLLSRALSMTGEHRTAHILVATSGDTGKAALEGYRDIPGIRMTVFYPADGVSRMQKLQMQTQLGDNVYVSAVNGNFDDAQTGVKKIFSDASLADRADREGMFFSSANSINWGRLAPQIVYYISAYCDLMAQGKVVRGEPVDFCVPTGNFGNIFAAYTAKRMGLPVGRLVCASNANRVLTDFIETGVYDRRRVFHKTMSPSMDILISSNLERLLYVLGGPGVTRDLMAQLNENGFYRAPDSLMERLRQDFSAYSCDEAETSAELLRSFRDAHYLCDPHTAVAMGCAEKYLAAGGTDRPLVTVSTASPFKFPGDVCTAIGAPCASDDPVDLIDALVTAAGVSAPAPLLKTLTLPIRFTGVTEASEMPEVVFRSR